MLVKTTFDVSNLLDRLGGLATCLFIYVVFMKCQKLTLYFDIKLEISNVNAA